MDVGHHFALNADSTHLQNNIVVFDYLHVNQGACSLQLSFSEQGVGFHLHQMKDNVYFSGCILFLPLSLDKNFRTELTTTLNEAYVLKLPNCSYSVNHLEKTEKEKQVEMLYLPDKFRGGDSLSVARLLLDFMFDLEHSTVFEQDPLFETVYSTLHEHLLFRAITDKADFDFYKRSYGLVEDAYLVRSERRWVEMLISHPLDLLFHESPWFESPVDELLSVYKEETCTLDCVIPKKKLEETPSKKSTGAKLATKTKQTAQLASQWFMDKYRPDGVVCIKYGRYYKTVWGAMAVILFLQVLLLFAQASCPCNQKYVFVAPSIGLAIVFLFLIFFHKVKRNLPFLSLGPSILMPRLFAAIAAGWMTIGLSDVALVILKPTISNGPDIVIKYQTMFWWVAGIVLIVLIIFLCFSIRRVLPFLKIWGYLLISFCLLMLSLVYSVLIGAALFYLYAGGKSLFFNPENPEYPASVMVFSFISMFVGVFIQLLFQGKSISSSDDR